MANIWSIPNPISLDTIPEASAYQYTLPLVDSINTTTTLISGSLPGGLYLKNNEIIGTPHEVVSLKKSKFVIRAVLNSLISDRTFTINVDGADITSWVTNEGELPIGPSDSYYILDESYVDFQLLAIDNDIVAGQQLTFWINQKDGILPPGLTLSPTGRIYGFIKPLLSQTLNQQSSGFYDTNPYDSAGYDKGTINSYGFDSYGFDFLGYGYSEYYPQPKKLNRNYEFVVSISDGNTITQRKFKIFVVGDDSFFSDNDSLHLGDTDYTADVSSLRNPLWFTPSDLGSVRASNYQTFKLDIYETEAKNPVLYSIDTFNPDGTICQLPHGMQFDTTTAEIFGIIPYQPAVTKTFNFTVTATRIGKVRPEPIESTIDTFPIKLNNTIVYRNYALESYDAYRIYTSLDYISGESGVKLYRPTLNSVWIYRNFTSGETYYSEQSVLYPWEIYQWYADINHTISATGPTLTVLPTNIGTYKSNYDTASSSRTFTLKVIGEIDNNIKWITESNLGVLEVETPSTLYVEAKCTNTIRVTYSIISGTLPPGLYMNSLGEITGKINQFEYPRITNYDFILDNDTTTIDRSYTFEVLASDLFGLAQISKKFTIEVYVPNDIQYSDVYVKPLLKPKQRDAFTSFIYNNEVFENDAIYRHGDQYFGIQSDMTMLVYAGIETKSMIDILSTVGQNHLRKKFQFGDVKKAVAKIPGTHTKIYEVIYVEILDPLEIGKKHLPLNIFTSKDNVPITIDNSPFSVTIDRTNMVFNDQYTQYKQPSSISLWRKRINDMGHHERHRLPLWMRTIQDGSMVELDYTPAIVLCYCKIGMADSILLNIQNYISTTGFNFNDIDFDIDRYIISSTKNNIVVASNIDDKLQANSTNSTVVLDLSASTNDNSYVGMNFIINNETKTILSYNGATKQAVLNSPLSFTPVVDSAYSIQYSYNTTDKYIYFPTDRTQIA